MSTAKSAIDSTFRRILNYTAEIIISIILLVIICIPLVFTIPMWFQHVLLNTPRHELTINPVAWFGYDGVLWVTLLLGLVSFSLGHLYILKLKPGDVSTADADLLEEVPERSDDEPATIAAEDTEEEEEISAEDQEETEEEIALDIDELEDTLEDLADDDEESSGDD